MQHFNQSSKASAGSREHTDCLLTSCHLARFLGCSERHIFNLRKRGMPAYRIGEIVRFDLDQVRQWLDSNGKAAPANKRLQQLTDIAASADDDNAECAAADLAREQT